MTDLKRAKVFFFIYKLGEGGAARTILNIVNHINKEKYEPVIITLDFNSNYESLLLKEVEHIKLPVTRLRNAILPLSKLIKERKPDLVFSTVSTYNVILLLATLYSRMNPSIIVREAALLEGSAFFKFKLKLIGALYKRADKVVALSQGVKENLIANYHVHDKHIRVIHNPVDLEHIQASMQLDLKEDSKLFQNGKKTILNIGRLVEDKDQATLIRAFYHVRKEMDCQLLILGEGKLKGELIQLVNELGLESDVHFLGFKKNPYNYLAQSDVFVLTSLREGFGHVLVEALATGTLIVTTDCRPGSKEVLLDGKYGKVVPIQASKELAKEIQKTFRASRKTNQRQVEKGYQRALDFSAPNIVKEYELLFDDILEQRRGEEK